MARPVFPSRPLTFLCPFPAGGIVDIVIRTFNEDLAERLGQPVAVDARPGAGGMIASTALHNADPDGHTIMMATLSHLTAPLFTPADYHPVEDFVSVAQVCSSVGMIVVPTALGVGSIDELIALDASDPGALNYIKPGNGSFGHLMVETLNLNAGTSIRPIDYQGLPPGIIDLLANRVQVGVLSVSQVVQHAAEGTLTPIAAVGNVRAAAFPDVPTLPEQGHEASNIETVFFVIAPAGTPQGAVERLHGDIAASVASDRVQSRIAELGLLPVPYADLAVLQDKMASAHAGFDRLVKAMDI